MFLSFKVGRLVLGSYLENALKENKTLTWWVSCKRQELLPLREHLDLFPVFAGVRVTHRFLFCFPSFVALCIPFLLLRPVSCVSNVACVSKLFILDFPFGFL